MSTDPVAAITAREAKFSEAMSCKVVFWRSSSRRMMSKSSRSSLTRSSLEPASREPWQTRVMSRRRLGVALLLDAPVSHEVDALRRALGDPSLGRVPPHVTLVPPVNVPTEHLSGALVRLRDAACAVDSRLVVTLGAVSSFLPGNPVVYLSVGGDVDGVRAVRDAAFRPPLARRLSWPWVPHVTLADGIDPAEIPGALATLRGYSAVCTFDRVVLLEQASGREWRPLADAALGPRVTVGTGGLAIELTGSSVLDPEALRMLRESLPEEPLALDGACSNAGSPAAIVLTARRERRVAGVGAAWSEARADHVAVLVAPGDRRQGVGAQLAGHLHAATARAGWLRGELEVHGPPAFYAAVGRWSAPTRTRLRRTGPAS